MYFDFERVDASDKNWVKALEGSEENMTDKIEFKVFSDGIVDSFLFGIEPDCGFDIGFL